VYAALLASAFAWLIHAGLDWDWEMPAATVWLFCVGGAALAAGTREINRRLRLRRAVRFGLALVFLAIAVVPAALTVSERRLNEARSALARGDCPRAETEARRSLDVIGFRPEPSETIALCAARRGALPEAEAAARETVSRDPGNWRYRYLLALVVAAGGGDGMPAARTAAALNPRDPTAAGAPAVLRGPAAETRARTLLSGGG
jgi:hypothetical protein